MEYILTDKNENIIQLKISKSIFNKDYSKNPPILQNTNYHVCWFEDLGFHIALKSSIYQIPPWQNKKILFKNIYSKN